MPPHRGKSAREKCVATSAIGPLLLIRHVGFHGKFLGKSGRIADIASSYILTYNRPRPSGQRPGVTSPCWTLERWSGSSSAEHYVDNRRNLGFVDLHEARLYLQRAVLRDRATAIGRCVILYWRGSTWHTYRLDLVCCQSELSL